MADEERTRTLTVHVTLPPGPLPEEAVLRLRVEDVSAADRVAPVLARAEVPVAPDTRLVDAEVAIPAGLVDPRMTYAVFAHLDVGGTGEVKSGDALTTQVYPVPAPSAPDQLDVRLTRI